LGDHARAFVYCLSKIFKGGREFSFSWPALAFGAKGRGLAQPQFFRRGPEKAGPAGPSPRPGRAGKTARRLFGKEILLEKLSARRYI
jgi:hypothetical protein